MTRFELSGLLTEDPLRRDRSRRTPPRGTLRIFATRPSHVSSTLLNWIWLNSNSQCSLAAKLWGFFVGGLQWLVLQDLTGVGLNVDDEVRALHSTRLRSTPLHSTRLTVRWR